MISINIITPSDMQQLLASRMRELRLARNLSQQSLAARSGVSYGSLKKFEQTGQISLASLLKLATVLGRIDDFNALFTLKHTDVTVSLDDLLKKGARKRGRQ